MKTFRQFLESEQVQYDNWVRYTGSSVKSDFVEYKKKEESKWKDRAERIGMRFPIFDSEEQFRTDLDNAKIVSVSELDNVRNMSHNSSIEDIESMVSSYHQPRDVKRIVQGLKNNVQIPMPIILKGSKGMWIMAGNTRQSTARVLGIDADVLLVDVSK
jgi:hypothetical protein